MNAQTGIASGTELEKRLLRNTFGRFTTGVTVLLIEDRQQVHGMTANSFVSVSLEPPLILVSLHQQARASGEIRKAGRFSLSVLADNQHHISQHFAGRPMPGFKPEFLRLGDVPVIRGAVAHLSCRLYQEIAAGDHTLFLGEVFNFKSQAGDPLLFHGGQYARLANNSKPQVI